MRYTLETVSEIENDKVRLGYTEALREYRDEIRIGKSILEVLDERYEFAKEDY